MQLQINYQCDICAKSFLLDFNKALTEKKLKCSNCGVEYKFTQGELKEFNQCYQSLLKRLKASKGETQEVSQKENDEKFSSRILGETSSTKIWWVFLYKI